MKTTIVLYLPGARPLYAPAPCSRSRAWWTWWVPWRVQRPPAGAAVLDDGRERFLPFAAPVDELEPERRHLAGSAALLPKVGHAAGARSAMLQRSSLAISTARADLAPHVRRP